jgi:hypothetical protein
VLSWYDQQCEGRGLHVEELEDASQVYKEQRALVEGLIRLAATLVVPALLSRYDILQVEQPGVVPFVPGVDFSFRPDALMREKESGDLYILSWKTCSSWRTNTEVQARVDMQNNSELWGQEQVGGERVAGVQMVFLVKGRKVPRSGQAGDLAEEQKQKRVDSPLVWGYRDPSFPPKFATGRFYNCTYRHPMRKSKWYPSGMCEQIGKLHKRGDEWEAFPIWEAGLSGKEWMGMLLSGEVEGGQEALTSRWVMPVPVFRNSEKLRVWEAQSKLQAQRIEGAEVGQRAVDSFDGVFPQYTHQCTSYYGARCPCFDLCWGPPEIAQAPLQSGIYCLPEKETHSLIEEVEE